MKQVQKHPVQAIPAPNTGNLLNVFFKKRRISKAALARTMNRIPNTIATYTKNDTIQTAVLWELCHALKHNFFADIAAQLPDTYTTEARPDTSKDERIAQLEKEVDVLKAKYEAVLEVAKGR